ncbi:type II secretion system F family protein [Catenuloplanes atrovinosus]|uniref:Tight adherence protein C n=1 Tax=Catenuloplanes atrovinosus TaxID=137266 RepID=A0AAE3YU80_9ACTN|nr:type II secretion system F family protein [Catenuloplanes atrovinosus]MDR7279994.1 tight adherence protein C [Catenuloplanes atrovinosus]
MAVDLIVLGAGLTVIFAALLILFLALVVGDTGRRGLARALADINAVYAPGAAHGRRTALSTAPYGRNALGRAVTLLASRLTPDAAAGWLQRALDHAGNPPNWPPARILEAQGWGVVVGVPAGALLGLGLVAARDLSAIGTPVLCALAGGLIGLCGPYLLVLNAAQRRQERLLDTLPDTLDMLTLCVEAGLGFDAALMQVAAGIEGPLSGELARALQEMQMGKRRAEALRALADRTTIPELRNAMMSIVQATELGIPVASVLREQSREMRVKRRQRAEERARKVPIKILFPLVFCLFPALFVVILGPGVLRIIDTFTN